MSAVKRPPKDYNLKTFFEKLVADIVVTAPQLT